MPLHHIQTSRTARIYTEGKPVKNIWLIAHGYGMLAEFFIKKFSILDPEENFFVVPEALSRAYLEGFSGKVGAVWMTSEDRENEISDYIQYLDSVYDHFVSPHLSDQVKVIAFGFSQGSTTMARWANANPERFDRLIVWGGSVPEDVLTDLHIAHKRIDICLGDNDPFIPADRVSEYQLRAEKLLPKAQFHLYKGGHQLEDHLLKRLATVTN
jgi:predicted esterase